MNAIVVTRHNFDQVVLDGSAERPVLVDFWAPWCGPCRTLAPVLDRVAAEFAGRFTLAKLNTEEEPELAARYAVRGIPNCKLFANREVVDEFTGALPERAVREFLAAALPSKAAPLVAAAKRLLGNREFAAAWSTLEEAMAVDSTDEDVSLTRAEALLALDRPEEASAILAGLETAAQRGARIRDPRRVAALAARAALGVHGEVDLDRLARDAARVPTDCAAKLAYARALAAREDYEGACAALLDIVRTDREFGDDTGRRTMLTIFEALPPDSDLLRRYRRELSAILH